MTAPVLMIQGTASSVGKSILTTALCRIFADDGLRVAPFKAQNMALNSHATADGCEIGRAQAVQAEAAGVEPRVDMNPVLLKPEGEARSQVVVDGRPIGSMGALDYHAHKPMLRRVVRDSLARLRAEYDLVVIEGAGSPAEINLKAHDIVNMDVALSQDAPVLLCGDIDRGGVFAAIVGTMELLEPAERALVAGFVINKFRGDIELLRSGLTMLEERTGVPVLGVIPHIDRLRIADEDSLALDDRPARRRDPDALDIAVVRLPRISNHDDFQPLEHEPGVAVRFVTEPDGLTDADLVILPGTKATRTDLGWLRRRGIDRALAGRARLGRPILGVCGGCQILGRSIADPDGVEDEPGSAAGLALLPLDTRFAPGKHVAQIVARSRAPGLLASTAGEAVSGYEIHAGRTTRAPGANPVFAITGDGGERDDGARSADGTVVGTMIHGLFDNACVRRALLSALRARRGSTSVPAHEPAPDAPVDPYAGLARAVRRHLDLPALERLLFCRPG